MDVSEFNEGGYNRQVTKVRGFYVCPAAAACTGLEVGAECSQEESWEKRKTLNTLQKQTPQSSMAYSDALTMKLLEIQPTRLLLNVTGSAMLTVCPSHGPPPNPN